MFAKVLPKWLYIVVFSAFMMAACGGQNQENAATQTTASESAPSALKGKVLRVATNAEFAPFESRNEKQEITGFDVDLMAAMAKAGDFSVEFQHKPWESLFPALNNGDVDVVMAGVTITDERRQTMDFSEPYYEVKQIILVPPTKNVKSVEDLKKLNKVGVVTGYTGDLAAQKIFGTTSQQIARFDNMPLLLKEIENGGLDAAISDSPAISHYVKNNSDKGFTMVKVPDFDVEVYGVAVKKGNTEILKGLDAALKTVRENGEYDRISKQYFAE